jgi:hypothetical protein
VVNGANGTRGRRGAAALVEQRRARLVDRHLLDGSAGSALDAARSVVVLHATDPATVYLSVLARGQRLAVADVSAAMYRDRSLVRMLAMRRTLFVVPSELAPVLHHAASLDVAAMMRRRLLKQLATIPTEPALPDDLPGWLADVEEGVERAMERLGVASGVQLSEAEPRLRTALLPTTDKAYDVRRSVTSQVLALMGAEGRLVRREPRGTWTSRQHTWEAGSAWWPEGLPDLDPGTARSRLVEAYLARFGPVTETDIAWWTGWSLGATRKALAEVTTEPMGEGFVLADDTEDVAVPAPTAALLPALDPTPMGWQQREWYLPEDPRPLFDSYGNVGPTVWWGGEVIGGWAVGADGSISTRLLLDRGAEARAAVDAAAQGLQPRLEGAVVVPSFRTPLERELCG